MSRGVRRRREPTPPLPCRPRDFAVLPLLDAAQRLEAVGDAPRAGSKSFAVSTMQPEVTSPPSERLTSALDEGVKARERAGLLAFDDPIESDGDRFDNFVPAEDQFETFDDDDASTLAENRGQPCRCVGQCIEDSRDRRTDWSSSSW